MKIAIIGYGKMGKIIERIARERGHEIVSIIDVDNHADMTGDKFRSAQVAIEFTTPATAASNCSQAMAQGVKVVSGTTGWASRMGELKTRCEAGEGTLMWSSNFSLGVNLFFAINRYVTALMSRFSQYAPSMEEIHHIHKLDHPSGTAITLAEQIINLDPSVNVWTEADNAAPDQLKIAHRREGEVPGTHIIHWDSPVDTITIEHCAKSREGFALGAVIAAEWIENRTGFFTMDQMMRSIIPAKLSDITL